MLVFQETSCTICCRAASATVCQPAAVQDGVHELLSRNLFSMEEKLHFLYILFLSSPLLSSPLLSSPLLSSPPLFFSCLSSFLFIYLSTYLFILFYFLLLLLILLRIPSRFLLGPPSQTRSCGPTAAAGHRQRRSVEPRVPTWGKSPPPAPRPLRAL